MNQLINFFYLAPNATIYNISPPVTYPMANSSGYMWIYPRPDESKCPICHDTARPMEFYTYYGTDPDWKPYHDPKKIFKDNCEYCQKKGLHPMPLTEFWDELSYDAVDLP